MEGIIVRRVIPSDNSCLFNAVGYVSDYTLSNPSTCSCYECLKTKDNYCSEASLRQPFNINLSSFAGMLWTMRNKKLRS